MKQPSLILTALHKAKEMQKTVNAHTHHQLSYWCVLTQIKPGKTQKQGVLPMILKSG